MSFPARQVLKSPRFVYNMQYLFYILSLYLQVVFTVDIRTIDDVGREAIIYELSNQMHSICDRRSVSCLMERKVHRRHNYTQLQHMGDLRKKNLCCVLFDPHELSLLFAHSVVDLLCSTMPML